MGNLSGHILPGVFFLVFGLWWTWSVFHKYFLSLKEYNGSENYARRKKTNKKYKNTVAFPCFACHRVPMEGILKVVATSIGIIGELATAFRDGKLVNYGNIQHVTMYFFFGLNGVMDILTFYNQNLVPDLDFISGILAYFMEGILFLYHLSGQNEMSTMIHYFLVYVIFATAISAMCEMLHKSSVLPALCRVFFTLLQGTWFIQIGFILYVYDWVPGPNNLKTVTFVFTWHWASIFIFLLIVGYGIRWRVKHLGNTVPYDVVYPAQPLRNRYFENKVLGEENIIFTDSDNELCDSRLGV